MSFDSCKEWYHRKCKNMQDIFRLKNMIYIGIVLVA